MQLGGYGLSCQISHKRCLIEAQQVTVIVCCSASPNPTTFMRECDNPFSIKMASPFRRKDIAKAFFDLDVSDTESSSHSPNPTTNKGKQKLTLLTLPQPKSESRYTIFSLLAGLTESPTRLG